MKLILFSSSLLVCMNFIFAIRKWGPDPYMEIMAEKIKRDTASRTKVNEPYKRIVREDVEEVSEKKKQHEQENAKKEEKSKENEKKAEKKKHHKKRKAKKEEKSKNGKKDK